MTQPALEGGILYVGAFDGQVHAIDADSAIPSTASPTLKVILDLLAVRFLMSYSTRPIHVSGLLGLLSGLAVTAMLLYMGTVKLSYGRTLATDCLYAWVSCSPFLACSW